MLKVMLLLHFAALGQVMHAYALHHNQGDSSLLCSSLQLLGFVTQSIVGPKATPKSIYPVVTYAYCSKPRKIAPLQIHAAAVLALALSLLKATPVSINLLLLT